jgi:hypothetical protein
MNHAKIERELTPRRQRLMRELSGPEIERDPEVRYWRRVSAMMCVASATSLIVLLAIAGIYAPTEPVSSAMPTEAVAGVGRPDPL